MVAKFGLFGLLVVAAATQASQWGEQSSDYGMIKRTEGTSGASSIKPFIQSKLISPPDESVGVCKASAQGTLQSVGEIDTGCKVSWSDKKKHVKGTYHDITPYSTVSGKWKSCSRNTVHSNCVTIGDKKVDTKVKVEKCGAVTITIDIPADLKCEKKDTQWVCTAQLPDVKCDTESPTLDGGASNNGTTDNGNTGEVTTTTPTPVSTGSSNSTVDAVPDYHHLDKDGKPCTKEGKVIETPSTPTPVSTATSNSTVDATPNYHHLNKDGKPCDKDGNVIKGTTPSKSEPKKGDDGVPAWNPIANITREPGYHGPDLGGHGRGNGCDLDPSYCPAGHINPVTEEMQKAGFSYYKNGHAFDKQGNEIDNHGHIVVPADKTSDTKPRDVTQTKRAFLGRIR